MMRRTVNWAKPIIAAMCALWPGNQSRASEQALIVHFQYGSTNLDRLFALEGKLERAIHEANVGDLDGDEVATDGSNGFLYMYGPSADRLLKVVEPVLKSASFMDNAEVTRRYGSAKSDARELKSKIRVFGPTN